MKNIFAMLTLLLSFGIVSAQTDSTITTQIDRQQQNKSSMNKSSGNRQAPNTANIHETRRTRVMTRKNNPRTTLPVEERTINNTAPTTRTATQPDNTNTVKPSVTNGNATSKDAGTKVPEP